MYVRVCAGVWVHAWWCRGRQVWSVPSWGLSLASSHMGSSLHVSLLQTHRHMDTHAHTQQLSAELQRRLAVPSCLRIAVRGWWLRFNTAAGLHRALQQNGKWQKPPLFLSHTIAPSLSFCPCDCLCLPLSITFPLAPQFNTDLTASIILQRRLFADAAQLSIRTDTQSGSNVTSPHYVNG